jgi:tryptophan 7-halogenase
LSLDRVQSIAIVGAGAAAWLAAATLARRLRADFCSIRVIESTGGATSTFSETVLPSFHRLNSLLAIDENDLLRKTRGTFRLGAKFNDWGQSGDQYFHTYGSVGAKLDAVSFHHYWIKLRQAGDLLDIEEYSTATVAAKNQRFAHASLDRHSMLSLYSYGYHFHASLLAGYLREYALAHGVTGMAGKVAHVQLRSDGFIEALQMHDGSRIAAELYIDCGGVPGRVFGRPLPDDFEDWSRWLPCDRAVDILCAGASEPAPYAEATAKQAGWLRRTPLQGFIDNTYIYSSSHISDDEAVATLRRDLPGPALTEPRLLSLPPGRPARFWEKNRIALTGSAADLLEATGLHLVQTAITRLLTLFPVRQFSPVDIEEYNRLTAAEHERIRDFLILHFKATQRGDSAFWNHCRELAIPDTLRAKVDLFRCCGRMAMLDDEHFGEDSWLTLFVGQNLEPRDYDPLADVLDLQEARAALLRMRSLIQEGVDTLPTHANYLAEHCPAELGAGW